MIAYRQTLMKAPSPNLCRMDSSQGALKVRRSQPEEVLLGCALKVRRSLTFAAFDYHE